MASSSSSTPPPITDVDSNLVGSLYDLSHKNKRLVRSSLYDAPADPARKIRSWKMDEFKYYNVPSPFPTLARGLFTEKVKGGEDKSGPTKAEDQYRIVARGYDKFFNIGEVPWTNWAALQEHTTAPYVLTLKSNGCIIFIAALSPTQLLITSKHSLGPVAGSSVSHAERGEHWLKKHLAAVGKTTEDLAAKLWETKWTAVAELCDDSFEEHVLPYATDKTGLHLHGLNACTKAFHTQPTAIIDAFAAEWGFIQTLSTELDSVQAVKEFTDEVGKSGQWNGEALEGFVVRTHVAGAPPSDGATEPQTYDRRDRSHPPYPPGSSFFFKVKFDEPYMMYRDWREVTKMLLNYKGPGPLVDASISKSKMKRPETKLYKKWVSAEIERDRKQFEDFAKGRGIIATRERFLKWLESEEGKKGLLSTQKEDAGRTDSLPSMEGRKTIIVPIAIPGCGKTTIAVALAHLFGFGHTQSDDVRQKKAAPIFLKNVTTLLKHHDVVIADKNNHLRQHRSELRDATKSFRPTPRLLALNWAFDLPQSTIHRICAERISRRGDNHQSLHADARAKTHEDVIWMFLKNSNELDPDREVDAVIEMDVSEDMEKSLDRAVDGVCKALGLEKPDQEKVGEALALARGYEPAIKNNTKNSNIFATAGGSAKDAKDAKKLPAQKVRYFGFLPELDVGRVVEDRMTQDSPENPIPEWFKQLWNEIHSKGRVTDRPHITIVHQKSLPAAVELWDRCMGVYKSETASSTLFEFKLGNIIASKEVVALTVERLDLAKNDEGEVEESGEEQQAGELVSNLPHEVRDVLHITIGTRNNSIPPVNAKYLVERWKQGKIGEDVVVLPLENVSAKGVLKGLVG